jgi:hypothetical protein
MYKFRAERKAGELLSSMEKHPGSKNLGADIVLAPKLEEIGITHKQSSRWQLGAKLPEDNRIEEVINSVPKKSAEQKETRDDVKIWIIENQFGRRNLQPYTKTNLALLLEPLIAAKAKANQGTRTDLCQISDKCIEVIDTKKEIAKIADVSHDTVAKVKVINKAKEQGKVSSETIAKLHSGAKTRIPSRIVRVGFELSMKLQGLSITPKRYGSFATRSGVLPRNVAGFNMWSTLIVLPNYSRQSEGEI